MSVFMRKKTSAKNKKSCNYTSKCNKCNHKHCCKSYSNLYTLCGTKLINNKYEKNMITGVEEEKIKGAIACCKCGEYVNPTQNQINKNSELNAQKRKQNALRADINKELKDLQNVKHIFKNINELEKSIKPNPNPIIFVRPRSNTRKRSKTRPRPKSRSRSRTRSRSQSRSRSRARSRSRSQSRSNSLNIEKVLENARVWAEAP